MSAILDITTEQPKPPNNEPVAVVGEETNGSNTSQTTPNAGNQLDLNNISIQNLLRALGTNLGTNFDANSLVSKMFARPSVVGNESARMSPIEVPKRTRMKVLANGFFMTFDKVSSCKRKHFWRCEYKNTCKARMHTDTDNKVIESSIHQHNHLPPTPEEISLYGLDPNTLEKDKVYLVNNISDPTQRRRIRKQVAEREAAAQRYEEERKIELNKQQNAAALAAVQGAYAQILSNSGNMPSTSQPQASLNEILLAQLPFIKTNLANPQASAKPFVAPSPPIANLTTTTIPKFVAPAPILKQPVVEQASNVVAEDPKFPSVFYIAEKLRKVWKKDARRTPRCSSSPTDFFEFYVSNDGDADNFFVDIRIEKRNETMLKEALEKFVGQKCLGKVVFGFAPSINVVISEPLMSSWDNSQFFLLNTSDPACWQLNYLDESAA